MTARTGSRRTLGWFLYQPYKCLVFAPLAGVLTGLFATVAVVVGTLVNGRWASRLGGVPWARLIAWVTPMLVTVRGRELVDPGQSYVVVANHQSHYDVFVVYGWLGLDFKWVMKQELRHVPGIGLGCEKVGHIFIDRSDHAAAVASIERAKAKIAGGTSVFFFPEGTRGSGGALGPFKKGAFRLALDLGLPILPVTILGTDRVLPARTFDLMPGRATLVIHPAIPTDGCDPEDLEALMARTRAVIAAGLEGGSRQGVAEAGATRSRGASQRRISSSPST